MFILNRTWYPHSRISWGLSPCPEVTAVDSEHVLIRRTCFAYTQNLTHTHTYIYIYIYIYKGPYVTTHTLETIEDNHLKTHVHSVSSGVETTEHYKVLWEHSPGIVLIHVWYGTSLQLIPQQQLRHLQWLVRAVHGWSAFTSAIHVIFCVTDTATNIKTNQHLSTRISKSVFLCISTSSMFTGTNR
jgi:hypothetical protein